MSYDASRALIFRYVWSLQTLQFGQSVPETGDVFPQFGQRGSSFHLWLDIKVSDSHQRKADGFPSNMLRLIHVYYLQTKSRVQTRVGQTKSFEVQSGCSQGCIRRLLFSTSRLTGFIGMPWRIWLVSKLVQRLLRRTSRTKTISPFLLKVTKPKKKWYTESIASPMRSDCRSTLRRSRCCLHRWTH